MGSEMCIRDRCLYYQNMFHSYNLFVSFYLVISLLEKLLQTPFLLYCFVGSSERLDKRTSTVSVGGLLQQYGLGRTVNTVLLLALEIRLLFNRGSRRMRRSFPKDSPIGDKLESYFTRTFLHETECHCLSRVMP